MFDCGLISNVSSVVLHFHISVRRVTNVLTFVTSADVSTFNSVSNFFRRKLYITAGFVILFGAVEQRKESINSIPFTEVGSI